MGNCFGKNTIRKRRREKCVPIYSSKSNPEFLTFGSEIKSSTSTRLSTLLPTQSENANTTPNSPKKLFPFHKSVHVQRFKISAGLDNLGSLSPESSPSKEKPPLHPSLPNKPRNINNEIDKACPLVSAPNILPKVRRDHNQIEVDNYGEVTPKQNGERSLIGKRLPTESDEEKEETSEEFVMRHNFEDEQDFDIDEDKLHTERYDTDINTFTKRSSNTKYKTKDSIDFQKSVFNTKVHVSSQLQIYTLNSEVIRHDTVNSSKTETHKICKTFDSPRDPHPNFDGSPIYEKIKINSKARPSSLEKGFITKMKSRIEAKTNKGFQINSKYPKSLFPSHHNQKVVINLAKKTSRQKIFRSEMDSVKEKIALMKNNFGF